MDILKGFKLLPLSDAMKAVVSEIDPMAGIFLTLEKREFDYVKFFRGKAYFYSKAYIDAHTLDELLAVFEKNRHVTDPNDAGSWADRFVEALALYLQHKMDCEMQETVWSANRPPRKCTCGLNEILDSFQVPADGS